eukprot:8697794-Lingulodinium_polyedra.AAC.1
MLARLRKAGAASRGALAVAALRVACRGLCTSSRFKPLPGDLLPCIFGCDKCPDDLRHYRECRRLHSVLVEAMPAALSSIGVGGALEQLVLLAEPGQGMGKEEREHLDVALL